MMLRADGSCMEDEIGLFQWVPENGIQDYSMNPNHIASISVEIINPHKNRCVRSEPSSIPD
jgi:hypothetical protein